MLRNVIMCFPNRYYLQMATMASMASTTTRLLLVIVIVERMDGPSWAIMIGISHSPLKWLNFPSSPISFRILHWEVVKETHFVINKIIKLLPLFNMKLNYRILITEVCEDNNKIFLGLSYLKFLLIHKWNKLNNYCKSPLFPDFLEIPN